MLFIDYMEKRVSAEDIEAPLIVITSNGERELPGAFIRRCVVLKMEVGKLVILNIIYDLTA